MILHSVKPPFKMHRDEIQYSEYGRKIALLLKAKDIPQAQISNAVGVSRVPFNRFLRGQTELRFTDVMAILTELDIDLDSIITNELQQHATGQEQETEALGDDIEFVLNKMTNLGRNSYLGHLISHAELLGAAVPEDLLNRLKDAVVK